MMNRSFAENLSSSGRIVRAIPPKSGPQNV